MIMPPHPVLMNIAEATTLIVIVIGLIQNANYLIQLVFAAMEFMSSGKPQKIGALWRRYSDSAPPVAILVPAFNEEKSIVESITSLLSLHYPSFEVIVINDGSSDATFDVLVKAFDLKPISRLHDPEVPHEPIRGLYGSPHQSRLVVIDKENGGKADALNAGLNISRAPIFCSVDADSVLEPDALLRTIRPFIEDPDKTIAAGGTVRIANGCVIRHGQIAEVHLPKKILPLLQTVEYLRAFLMTRLAWSRMNTVLIVSGAFGLFQRSNVIEVGGYSLDTVGEDMELIVKLHRRMREQKREYRICFIPEPVCWTEAPESLAVLGRQRARWQRGTLETFGRHAKLTFNPRYGRIGFLGFGNILLTDVIWPLIELLGYILVPAFALSGILSIDYLLAYFAVTFAFGVAISIASLALEEAELRRVPRTRDLILLAAMAVFENLGYRQICNFWRLRGFYEYFRKNQSWGTMTRTGFSQGN